MYRLYFGLELSYLKTIQVDYNNDMFGIIYKNKVKLNIGHHRWGCSFNNKL